MWGLGGQAYDDVSFGLSDALAHAAQRLDARQDENILDVATGTGWSARNVARSGAQVSAVDISSDLLTAAKKLSAHIRPVIDFRLGDAEHLPFPDASFDGVISTFGVIFAHDQRQAARELGRVVRKGGRLVLATWRPDGSVAQFLGVIARHSDAPPPPASPLAWGDPAHVEALLGQNFALTCEPGINNAYHPHTEHIWDKYAVGFGPVRQLIARLPSERLAALRSDVDAYHRRYQTEAGLHVRREYLIVLGARK
jgi:SAM-dependent methyltransferase